MYSDHQNIFAIELWTKHLEQYQLILSISTVVGIELWMRPPSHCTFVFLLQPKSSTKSNVLALDVGVAHSVEKLLNCPTWQFLQCFHFAKTSDNQNLIAKLSAPKKQ